MSSTGLEFPHTSSGEIDWNTLGNILSANILGEVLCASYVDEIHGRGSKDFKPDTDWKFVYKEHDVIAFQKSFKDSPINAFMGRGVIDMPIEDIVQFLSTHERRKEWDRYLVEIKPLKRISETDVILYMHSEANNCLVKQERDFVQFERMAYVGEKYVRSAISVDLPEFPHKHNVIRAELRPGTGWVLEPFCGSRVRTLVSYLAHVDLKGLPSLITNRIMRRQPKAIHRIRKILTPPKHKPRGKLSREESIVESFTASDQREALSATLEYKWKHHIADTRYEESISINEFLGQGERRRLQSTPPMNHIDTTEKTKPRRSLSVDSATSKESANRYSGITVDSSQSSTLNGGLITCSVDLYVKEKKQPPQEVAATAVTAAAAAVVVSEPAVSVSESKGKEESRDTGSISFNPLGECVEFPVNTDPHIVEDTGFQGDSILPPFSSPPEDEEDINQGPKEVGVERLQVEALVEDTAGLGTPISLAFDAESEKGGYHEDEDTEDKSQLANSLPALTLHGDQHDPSVSKTNSCGHGSNDTVLNNLEEEQTS